MAYYMETMTVKEFRRAMESTGTAVIPIGLMEQHGYHLPLCTDKLFVTELLERIKDRINCVIAPNLNYCYSGGELPGTININPSVFGQFVCEITRSFFRMGFKSVVALVAHAGSENSDGLKNELTMFLRMNPHFKDRNLFLLIPHRFIKRETWDLVFNKRDTEKDWHAGMAETSLMLYWRPDLVKMSQAVVDREPIAKMMRTDPDWYAKQDKNIKSEFTIPWIHQREEIEVGVMGYPKKANRELGKKMSQEMEEGMIRFFDAVEKGANAI